MKKIRILRGVTVSTRVGPVSYMRGDEDMVEDHIAASLIGRGYAEATSSGDKEYSVDDLEAMTVVELRKLAQKAQVPDYHKIRKDALVRALAPDVHSPSFPPVDVSQGVIATP